MKVKKLVYLDNSATTPVDPQVLKEMLPYFQDKFGNASSLHLAGSAARLAVDESKKHLAEFFACSAKELYFTSGATESDNMAILGVLKHYQKKYPGEKWHIITSSVEHDAILESCQAAEKSGAEVTYLPVTSGGLVELKSLEQAIKPNTILVSIMYVNNEVGTIQPISEVGQFLKKINLGRKQKIYFHTDATQALPYVDCQIEKLGVDLLSASAHKIYGPKGVGLFYIKAKTPFSPLIFGGHQQDDIRPGTYNVPGIVGFGTAVKLLSDKKELQKENNKIRKLRDDLILGLQKIVTHIEVTGDLVKRVPGNASFIFHGVEGESVLLMLADEGIAISTGSACSSGSLDPSHVLMAMGIKPEHAHGSVRITLGRFSDQSDIEAFLLAIGPVIERLRRISPIKT